MKVAEKQSIRRQEIAATIRDILLKDKIEELTVDDICKANGISKGTFYHYFSSKKQLLDEISCYPIDDYFESQYEYIMSFSTFADSIEQYAKSYALYITTTGATTCKTVILSMGSNENDKFLSTNRSVNRILWDIIVKYQKSGEISSALSVQEMAEMFLITCRGYILYCYSTNNFADLERKMAIHLRAMAKGFSRKRVVRNNP